MPIPTRSETKLPRCLQVTFGTMMVARNSFRPGLEPCYPATGSFCRPAAGAADAAGAATPRVTATLIAAAANARALMGSAL